MSKTFAPPIYVRCVKELDRKLFDVPITLPAVRVPSKRVNEALSVVAPYLFKMRNIKPVTEDGDCRELLLDPGLLEARQLSVGVLKQKIVSVYGNVLPEHDIVEYGKALVLTYDNWTVEDVLHAVLPEGERLASYSHIGHIIHVNLRDSVQPYKYLIGNVILDKIANCKTVVNKAETIETVYRTFQFELLAGEPNYTVTLKENGCHFKFDFENVFWNPRLSTEHHRVYSKLKKHDTVYDVCAGVGPFSIPAAKYQKARCLVNDLNPDCVRWLRESMLMNKVTFVGLHNLDAADFIRCQIRQDLLLRSRSSDLLALSQHSYAILNLPAKAASFLGHFVGLCQGLTLDPELLRHFYVHCYTFSKADNAVADAKRQVEFYLGAPVKEAQLKLVRDVAPNKMMVRATFRIPEEVLAGLYGCPPDPSVEYFPLEPEAKKARLSSPPSATASTTVSGNPLLASPGDANSVSFNTPPSPSTATPSPLSSTTGSVLSPLPSASPLPPSSATGGGAYRLNNCGPSSKVGTSPSTNLGLPGTSSVQLQQQQYDSSLPGGSRINRHHTDTINAHINANSQRFVSMQNASGLLENSTLIIHSNGSYSVGNNVGLTGSDGGSNQQNSIIINRNSGGSIYPNSTGS